jgi:hypothetical protein
VSRGAGLGVIAALLTSLAGAAVASPPAPDVTCRFDRDAGELRIVHDGQAFPPTIVRDGNRITVTTDIGEEYRCAGDRPAVGDVDTISYVSRGFIDGLTIDLGKGRLGAEVYARLGGDNPVLTIAGSGRRERLTIGRVADGEGAINLDASESHDEPDVFFQATHERVELDLGRGHDRYSAASGRGYEGPYRDSATAVGGRDGDRLVGGPGRDVLVGDTGRDQMLGGPGRDTLFGDEYMHPHHTQVVTPDLVDCGPGDDKAYVDPADQTRGCERVHVRKPD